MPMIAKAPIKGAAKKTAARKKGQTMYRQPIGPDKDPGTQASKMRKFEKAYEAAMEVGNQGASVEKMKDVLQAHLKNAAGAEGGKEAVLEGMIEGTNAVLAGGKKKNLSKIRKQAKRAMGAYLDN